MYTGVPFAVHVVSNPAVVLITTSSFDPVNVHVSVTGTVGFEDLTTTVTRTQHAQIDFPPSIRLTGTGKRNATVKVTSSGVTSVHCIDNEYNGGDGFFVLPVTQLGKQYYVVSYISRYDTFGSVNYPSFICISALDQETSVQITKNEGQTLQLTLAPYESYRLDSDGEGGDLTGTFIEASNPIFVISGAYTFVPAGTCCWDGLIGPMFPIRSWKCSYVMICCVPIFWKVIGLHLQNYGFKPGCNGRYF